MHTIQKVFISLLLVAVFASSCSKTKTAESQKDKLMAQKERLITEISDLGGSLAVALETKDKGDKGDEGGKSDVRSLKKEMAKCMQVALSGLCGALERKEVTDTDLESLLRKHDAAAKNDNLMDSLLFLTKGTDETGSVRTLIEENIKNIKKKLPVEESRIDLCYNKIQDLIKVVKEIRELT